MARFELDPDIENTFARIVRGRRPAGSGPLAPAPPELPVLGHIQDFGNDRLHVMMRNALELGPVVRYELPFVTTHMVTEPKDVEEVLVQRHRAVSKRTRGYRKIAEFLGQGLVTSDGEFWKRQRRIAQPAFHKKRIDGFGRVMIDDTLEMLERWPERRAFDVSQEMMRLTLRIAGHTLLSVDTGRDEDSVGRAVTVTLHEANRRINQILSVPQSIPTARNRAFVKAGRELDDIVMKIIADRRASLGAAAEPHHDFLQMLMEAKDEETGEQMSDRQLRDEVMTMFLAGHETTANALAWTMALLAQHPTILARVRSEVRAAVGMRPLQVEDVPKLEPVRRVVNEAMRLYPPVWAIARLVEEEFSIQGYVLPRDSMVVLCPWVTHRLPHLWPRPEVFDPDRFAPEEEAKRPKYSFFPFIGGPRMCIGAGFAMLELVLVVTEIVRRFELMLEPGWPLIPEPLITLRPRDGLMMRVERVD